MAHEDCLRQAEISALQTELDILKRQQTDNTKDIQYLKENKASNDEKFERIFDLLGELKDSINEIQKAIKEKNDRLPNLVYSVSGMVIGGCLSGVIVWALTK